MREKGHRAMCIAGLALATICTSGCGTRGVTRTTMRDHLQRMNRTAIVSDQLSEYTLIYLRQRDLGRQMKRDPQAGIEQLDQKLCPQPDRGTLFVLAELCFLRAKKEDPRSAQSHLYYLSSCRYAYECLFAPDAGEPLSPFDPRFRLAAEFYNASLSSLFEFRVEATDPGTEPFIELPIVNGEVRMVGSERTRTLLDDLRSSVVAGTIVVESVPNQYRRFGLGVPLVASRESNATGEDADAARIRLTPKYAASLLLRFEDSLCASRTGDEPINAVLEAYDSVNATHVRIGDTEVPLESNLSAPLAYLLATRRMLDPALSLKGGIVEEKRGLYMFQPYERGKIPVVFVHGLMSSPLTWVPMMNELMADPALTERYQFWAFLYPTGNPILTSGGELRQSLVQARKQMDPEGADPAFDRMVVIGHSMGGLLTRLLITESHGDFLRERIGKDLEELELTPELQERYRAIDHFEPLPFVDRVMFLATPHHGADMARGPIGRFGSFFTAFPRYLLQQYQDLLQELGLKEGDVPGGIDNLQAGDAFLKTLNRLPMKEDVPFHLILGNERSASTPEGSDGMVDYGSARLEGAESELVVKSGHNVHYHPLAIREVRRVLLEHLEAQGEKSPTGT